VLIQTYRPGHESLVAAATHDGAAFSATELDHRRLAGYPPFNRLVEIRLSGKQVDRLREAFETLTRRLERVLTREDALLGPAPCPIETVRGLARWHVLIKTTRYARLQPQLAALLDGFERDDLPSSMKMLINVDPVDMM
jgi:primosomal protein N' (replication factor Y)